jgi:pre-mRNA splicing factor component
LQKLRELKAAGIAPKKKKLANNEMDYGREIPFEKPAPAGYFDTSSEDVRLARDKANETDAFRMTLLNKLEGDRVAEEVARERREKQRKLGALGGGAGKTDLPALIARELEDDPMSLRPKRSKLALPAPTLSDADLEELVRLGHRHAASSSSSSSSSSALGDGSGFDNDGGMASVVTGALVSGLHSGAGIGAGDNDAATAVSSMAAALLAKRASAAASSSVATAAQRREALLEEAQILAKLNREHQNPLLGAKAVAARVSGADDEDGEELDDEDDEAAMEEAEVLEDGTVISKATGKVRKGEFNLAGGTGFGGVAPFANGSGSTAASAKERGLASFFSSAGSVMMDRDGGDDSASLAGGAGRGGMGVGGATQAGLGLTFRDSLGVNKGGGGTIFPGGDDESVAVGPVAGQKRKAPYGRGSSAAAGGAGFDDSASVGAGSSFTSQLNGAGGAGSVIGFGSSALASKHISSSISLALASLPAPKNSYQLDAGAVAAGPEDEEDDLAAGPMVGPAKRRKLGGEDGTDGTAASIRDRAEADEELQRQAQAQAEVEFRKLSAVVKRQRIAAVMAGSSSSALPRPLMLPQGQDEVLLLTPTSAALADAIDRRAKEHPSYSSSSDGSADGVIITSKMLAAAESVILEEAALLLKNDAVKEPVSLIVVAVACFLLIALCRCLLVVCFIFGR